MAFQPKYRLYRMRYKAGLKGVQEGLIEASSLAAAAELGRQYCSREPNFLFIRIEDALLVSERDTPVVLDESEPENGQSPS